MLKAKAIPRGGILVIDDFSSYTAGSTPLHQQSANWTQIYGTVLIADISGDKVAVYGGSPGDISIICRSEAFGGNHYVEVEFKTMGAGGWVGVALRCKETDTCYIYYGNNNNRQIDRVVNGSPTQLDYVYASGWGAAGSKLRLEINGNQITCYANGALDTAMGTNGVVTDNNITGGKPGLFFYNANDNSITSFEAGEIGVEDSDEISGAASGAATVSAIAKGKGKMTASAASTATSQAGIRGRIMGVAAAVGVATVTAGITGKKGAAGTTQGTAGAQATIIARGQITASTQSQAIAEAVVQAKGAMAGTIQGQSAVAANIAGMAPNQMTGEASGSSALTATIHAKGQLQATIGTTASVQGVIRGRTAISAASQALSTTAASLRGKGLISGNIQSQSTSEAGLKGKGEISGTILGGASATGIIQEFSPTAFEGRSTGQVSVTGNIKGKGKITANSQAATLVSGNLVLKGMLQGMLSGVSILGGVLGAKGDLKGQIITQLTASGSVCGTGHLIGVSAAATSAFGRIYEKPRSLVILEVESQLTLQVIGQSHIDTELHGESEITSQIDRYSKII